MDALNLGAPSVTASAARFPARSFVSKAEFDEHVREVRDRVDARYRHELELASTDVEMSWPGTCAPCLRPTTYTSRTAGGECLPDGRRLPNWREELMCDCEDRIDARGRALLHFIQSVAGLLPATRVLVFGPATPVSRRIGKLATLVHRTRMLAATGAHRIDLPGACVQLVVCSDYLNHVPPLDAALAELRRVLVRGGQLVFTVPFRVDLAETASRNGQLTRLNGLLPAQQAAAIHDIGWDVLPRLRRAGFSGALAYGYWSEELGYLGPFNMILAATA